MAARDKSYVTLNYEQVGGSNWHIGGTLELGDAVTLTAGATTFSLAGVPTADPHVVGQVWNNADVVTISAG
jgi:hypothetical protein